MFGKSDNWYRHWFLNEMMKTHRLLRTELGNPIQIEYILRKFKNKRKADKAYYYLYSVQSVRYVDFNNIDHVALTEKGRNELLGEYYLSKEKEQRTLSRNNNRLIVFNGIMALGVLGTFALWVNPNLRRDIIIWTKSLRAKHTQSRLSHPPSETPPPNPRKTFVIDTASHK